MFPVVGHLHGVALHSYAIAIVVGYGLCALALHRSSRLTGIPFLRALDASFLCVALGFLGARLAFYLTVHDGSFWAEASIFSGGGLVFYGGFISAILGCVIFSRWYRLSPLSLLDALAPGLAIAHGLGRIGCFLAGCCHGSATNLPWGIALGSSMVDARLRGLPLHPVQLYEAAGLLFIFFFTMRILAKKGRAGTASLFYLGAYASLRFVLEFFRGDGIRGFWGPLSTSQWISLVLLFGLLAWGLIVRGIRRNH
jgi:phosphatidylglycerol---prolipoprotein diacylglyceryl transferase